jgi:hypothetical protein
LYVVAQDSRQFSCTSAPVSITVNLPAGYQPPQIQIISPPDGTILQTGTNITFSAAVTPGSVPVTSLQFLLDGAPLGAPMTQGPYSQPIGSLFTGTHQVSAIATDADGVAVSSATNHVTVSPPQAMAVFHGYDWSAQGSWPGLYGSDGQVIINYVTNVPGYAVASLTGAGSYTWASSTSDPRALLEPASQARFAAVWYTSSSEALDLNLLDGGPHRISLYCVDWANQGSAQTIQVLDAVSGTVLDSQRLTNFSKGVYLSWRVVGHVQFKIVSNSALAPASVMGMFFDPPLSAPAVSIISPVGGACYTPGSVKVSVSAVSVTTNLSVVELLANGLVVGSLSSGSPFVFSWANPTPGDDVLTARAVDANGSIGFSAPVSISVEPTTAAATFRSADYSRQGTWLSTFGRQGFAIAGVANNLPSDVQLQNGSQMVTWASSTTDPRALQSGSGSSRVAAAWYAFTNLVLDVKFTDGAFHRVALYFMDWANFGANQTLSVLDYGTGARLDTRVLPASTLAFGIWVVWEVKGYVRFAFNRLGPAPAVLNGIFFDPSSVLSPITISSPLAGSFFVAPTNIPLVATSGVDPNVARVDFYSGTTLLGSSSNGPPFNLAWTNAPLGIWTLLAREVGLLGGTTDSPPIEVSVISNLVSAARLSATPQAQGGLRLNMVSPLAGTVRLEAATNLGPGAIWIPLLTNSIGPSATSVTLGDATNYPGRFYRLVPVP